MLWLMNCKYIFILIPETQGAASSYVMQVTPFVLMTVMAVVTAPGPL
jgi:hypothetical protein